MTTTIIDVFQMFVRRFPILFRNSLFCLVKIIFMGSIEGPIVRRHLVAQSWEHAFYCVVYRKCITGNIYKLEFIHCPIINVNRSTIIRYHIVSCIKQHIILTDFVYHRYSIRQILLLVGGIGTSNITAPVISNLFDIRNIHAYIAVLSVGYNWIFRILRIGCCRQHQQYHPKNCQYSS